MIYSDYNCDVEEEMTEEEIIQDRKAMFLKDWFEYIDDRFGYDDFFKSYDVNYIIGYRYM